MPVSKRKAKAAERYANMRAQGLCTTCGAAVGKARAGKCECQKCTDAAKARAERRAK